MFGVLTLVAEIMVVVVLLLTSNQTLKRVRNILDILNNGGFRSCPHYVDQAENGRRWYDKNKLKGGEDP